MISVNTVNNPYVNQYQYIKSVVSNIHSGTNKADTNGMTMDDIDEFLNEIDKNIFEDKKDTVAKNLEEDKKDSKVIKNTDIITDDNTILSDESDYFSKKSDYFN